MALWDLQIIVLCCYLRSVPVHWKVKKKDDHHNFLKLKVSFLTGPVWPTLQNPKDPKYSESSIIQDNLTPQKL